MTGRDIYRRLASWHIDDAMTEALHREDPDVMIAAENLIEIVEEYIVRSPDGKPAQQR